MPATGTRVQATVSAARECSWNATTEAPWVALSPDAGQGEAQVTVAVAANDTPVARAGAIVLNGARVTVSQEAASCRFDLDRSSAQIGAEGGRVQVVDHGHGRLRVESVQPGILGEPVDRHRIGQPYRRAGGPAERGWCALGNDRHRRPQVHG